MIEIIDGIFWDETPNAIQSEETMDFIRTQIHDKMNDAECEYDKWNRPYKWVIPIGSFDITLERVYIDNEKGTWAKKKDIITLQKKSRLIDDGNKTF